MASTLPSAIVITRSHTSSVDNRWATITSVTCPLRSLIVSRMRRSDSPSSALVGSSRINNRGSPARARERDPLLLSARQPRPTRSEHRVEAVGQFTHLRRDMGGYGSPLDIVTGHLRTEEGDVVGDRCLDQLRLLRHDRHEVGPRRAIDRRVVDTVDQHRTAPGKSKPQEDLQQGRLAAPGRPDDAEYLTANGSSG